jgi:hypothetical protein
MPEQINLLIVEDSPSDTILYEDAIKNFNMEFADVFEIDATFKNTKEEGLATLYELKDELDGAFIDLRLSQTPVEDSEGNDIIKEIYGKLRFPVMVLTNTPNLIDTQFQRSAFLQLLSKDDDYVDNLKKFLTIHKTGISKILNNKGLIESHINEVFWKHISTVLKDLITYKEANATWDIEKSLLRYISSHIQEYLELTLDDTFEAYHPIEYYIFPSVNDKIFTGQILKHKNCDEYFFVATPACDLATDSYRPTPKANYVTLIQIENTSTIITGKNGGEIKKLYANNFELKYHYLPRTPQFAGGFINFQNINGLSIEHCNNAFDIVLSISNPFRKDIISRFSNYFSRQGQPAVLS